MMFGDKNGFLCVYVGRISNEKRLLLLIHYYITKTTTIINRLDVVVDAVRSLTGERRAYLAIVGDGCCCYCCCCC